MPYRAIAAIMVLAVSLVAPSAASAQFGLGPRMSFIRGDAATGTPSSRLFGGTVRMGASRRIGLELAMDYKTETSPDGLRRVKERPFQASMLLFLVRSTFSPYVLGGYGIYQQTIDTLNLDTSLPTVSVVEKKTGMHLGFGGELLLTRHTAFYLDYRFRFVQFGEPDSTSEPINIPGSSFIPGLDKVKLSHRGSMVTSGVAFYF
jgi:hypothetical protein